MSTWFNDTPGSRWLRLIGVGSALCLAAGGCDSIAPEEEEVEDLTIVVEADKSRILEEEQALANKRSEMESERERLSRERDEVAVKLASLSKKDRKSRDKLEAEQRRLEDEEKNVRERARTFEAERAKLDREKTELLERIATLTKRGTGGLTIEQREAQIARREKDIARREEAVAKREAKLAGRETQANTTLQELSTLLEELKAGGGTKTVIVNAPSTSSGSGPGAASTVTRAQAQKAQRSLRSRMDAKGILMDDLPPTAKTLLSQGNDFLGNKDFSEAVAAFEEAEGIVEGIPIDQKFLQAKMGRLNRAVKNKQLDEKDTKKVEGLLAEVSNAFADGRYDRANKKANQINALVLNSD